MTLKRDFGLKLELLASVGTSADMEQTAKSSIMKHFTGGWPNSGDESNNISEDMEKRYGGMWMVAVFDIDYDSAYTITRRSPSYMLWGANDRAILIAREGATRNRVNNPLL